VCIDERQRLSASVLASIHLSVDMLACFHSHTHSPLLLLLLLLLLLMMMFNASAPEQPRR